MKFFLSPLTMITVLGFSLNLELNAIGNKSILIVFCVLVIKTSIDIFTHFVAQGWTLHGNSVLLGLAFGSQFKSSATSSSGDLQTGMAILKPWRKLSINNDGEFQ